VGVDVGDVGTAVGAGVGATKTGGRHI
jgi:hypothetical protein